MKEFCTKKKNVIILTGLVVVHTILLFLLCDYEKSMAIYPDENLYYGMARTLFQGNGLKYHGQPFSFQNLGYTFFLVPFFFIGDGIVRIKAIMFANSFLMSLCIIPVWLICRELKLRERYSWYVIIIMLLWPDMLVAETFMSENIFYPAALFALYFIIKSFGSDQKRWGVLAALVSYFAYFCKAVAMCLPAAYIALMILYPFIQQLILQKGGRQARELLNNEIPRQYKEEHTLQKLGVYVGIFAACYIGVRLLFMLTPAKGTYALGVSATDGSTFYFICFMLYSMFYYVAAVLVAFFVYPVIYPLVHIKKLDDQTRKAFLFSLIMILGAIYVIVYSITVNEDFGALAPRVHLRYFSYVIGLLLPVFFRTVSVVEEDAAYADRMRKWILPVSVIAGMVVVFGFKWAPSGCCIKSLPLVFSTFIKNFCSFLQKETVEIATETLTVYPIVIVTAVGVVAILVIWGVVQSKNKGRVFFPVVLTAVMVGVCLLNDVTGAVIVQKAYQRDSAMIEEMRHINTYFEENHLEDCSVLYLALSAKELEDKVYDTYFDGKNNYETTVFSFYQSLSGDMEKKIPDACLPEAVYWSEYKMDTIDYLMVCTKATYVMEFVDGVEPVPELSGEHYRVYRNVDPETIAGKVPEKITYQMTQEGYNAYFGISGLGTCEGDYTWTDGKELEFEGYLPEDTTEAVVTVELEKTYHGVQEVALYQYESKYDSVFVKGKDSFSFHISVNHGNYSFQFRFPKKEASALGVKSITIEPVSDN